MYESMLRSAVDPWFQPEGATWHRGDRHRCLSHARLCIREALLEGKPGIESIGEYFNDSGRVLSVTPIKPASR